LDDWKNGETGFPVVDACMTQLNVTGYLHNRGRLIVASFLVKTLLLDWREGEKYFARQLTDYDVASNNGNWLWIMGGGADSQPWFRIFNPWEQGKNFDPDCEYIKKWIPALTDLDPKTIHNWNNEYSNYKNIKYAKPICDYKEQKKMATKMYELAFK
jgi:deoxyribodipyrimidine photo-lyase